MDKKKKGGRGRGRGGGDSKPTTPRGQEKPATPRAPEKTPEKPATPRAPENKTEKTPEKPATPRATGVVAPPSAQPENKAEKTPEKPATGVAAVTQVSGSPTRTETTSSGPTSSSSATSHSTSSSSATSHSTSSSASSTTSSHSTSSASAATSHSTASASSSSVTSHGRSVHFEVEYFTQPGEWLVVVGNVPQLGNWDFENAFSLQYNGTGSWLGTANVPDDVTNLEYKYVLVGAPKDASSTTTKLWEAGVNRVVPLSTCIKGHVALFDSWKPEECPEEGYLYTSIFQDIFKHADTPIKPVALEAADQVLVQFRATVGFVRPEQTVFVSGELPELGAWDPTKAVPLDYHNGYFYANVLVSVSLVTFPFEFKFLVKNADNTVAKWEEGRNRKIGLPGKLLVSSIVYTTIFRQSDYNWRGAGFAVPVFSLRTESGLGVGEFQDLKLLVDLCVKTGAKLIQILPINDTSCLGTWRDSYPYSALSVFALHPIYIHIPNITDDKTILAEVEATAKKLNALTQVDYEAVVTAKLQFIERAFAADKGKTLASKPFQAFFDENSEWLIPYAVFKYFSVKYETTDYTSWPQEARDMNKEKIFDVANTVRANLELVYYTQFHLHVQLREASQYASSRGVGIKGDLPIGVNLRSVDSWLNPHLFNLNMSTGAPPDQFSADGQNWGFPTYNWGIMAQDGYAWWKARLRQMAKYFQAFRIDHILGFFRIWEIPRHFESGLMGHFAPSIPLHRNELEAAGIWDIERLTVPYIPWHEIEQNFGHNASYIIDHFLYKRPDGSFSLRDSVTLAYLNAQKEEDIPQGRPGAAHMRSVLSNWMTNVVLLPQTENPHWHFYPRINMDKTTSFQALPGEWKARLVTLYNDYFFQRQEHMWGQIGLERLPIIKNASKMLVCGEDLGMIPKCVFPVMKRLSILGLRVQRMPPDPKILFGTPSEYPYMTVCTTSSHDCSTLRGWWEEDRNKTQQFFNNIMHEYGDAPQFCETWIARKIMEQHLYSPSMWAIFPIQDFFAMYDDLRVQDPKSEQINNPANPHHYWRYRIHVTLEMLNEHKGLVGDVQQLITRSGRS